MEYDKAQVEIEMIHRFVELTDRKILEIGCGDGHVSKLLAPKAREYVAIDPDERRIRKALSTATDVDFRIGSGETLEFEDASFQVVLFTLSLHHQDSRLALKEAHRVLTEKGQLVILEPATDGELQQFFNLFDDETDKLINTLKVMEASDFEIKHRETFHILITFDDQEELCSYEFDRNEIHPDDRYRILEILEQLQGPVSDIHPIHLRDKIHIFSLQKKRNNGFTHM
jgi:ubiquinone/menaquinone biosynthesis C-methylase UbiE